MNKFVSVYIKWLQEDVQHVNIPEKGIRFCPQIKFEDESNILPQWTAEIILRRWDSNNLCYGDLRYLFEDAPHYLLKKGKSFMIFDGPNVIASGKIMD